MGRQQAKRAVCDSPVQTSLHPPFQLLLQTSSNQQIRARANAAHRRNLYCLAILWLTEDRSRVEKRRLQYQPQTCAADHAAPWLDKQSAGAKYLKAASGTHQVPVFAKESFSIKPSRSLEYRYHLHPASKGIYIPRGRDRLVQPHSPFSSPFQQLGNKLLFRCLRRSGQMPWPAQNLQYRPGGAIYLSRVCQCRAREKHSFQHGWTRQGSRQCIRRAVMEVCEV